MQVLTSVRRGVAVVAGGTILIDYTTASKTHR